MKVILGSASPRRRELLAEITPSFDIRVSHADEHCTLPDPVQRVMFTAGRKAQALSVGADELIVCADTIVTCQGRVLGKPADSAEATQMLTLLNHNVNSVYTGVCLRTTHSWDFFCARSDVRIDMTPQALAAYVATGSPLDKAGAYGIQDELLSATLLSGSLSNVIGLPVESLREHLAPFLG